MIGNVLVGVRRGMAVFAWDYSTCITRTGCLGRRLSRPSRRARHLANPGGRSARASPHRHHAICRNAAAGGSRGGADLRRRAAAALQQPDSGNSGLAMREGDLLPGRPQAQANPEGVRKVRDAGHTVATHTQNHPPGIAPPADRTRPAGDRRGHRVGDGGAGRRRRAGPVLSRARPRARRSDRGLCRRRWASRSGAPISRPTTGGTISSSRVYELAMQRLEAKGKGILLLHDIQARTVAALPRILHELKARGYRIVHVVPATPEQPAHADRTAAMAVASAVGDGGDLALAQDSQFRFCRGRHAPGPRVAGFVLE